MADSGQLSEKQSTEIKVSGKGGKRDGAGRKPGVPNKATADVKEEARKHGPAAIKRLAHLMEHAKTDAAQVAACQTILDRAYGKATQYVATPEDSPIKVVHRIELVAPQGA